VETDGPTGRAAPLTSDHLLDLLYRRDVALAHHRHVLARTLGVGRTELLALLHLVRRGDQSPAALAELLDLSPGGVTALAQRLAAAGHVTRHRHPGHGRGTLLRVTPATAGALRTADAALDALPPDLSGEPQATVAAWLTALTERCEQLVAAERATAIPAAGAREPPVPSVWA
jgi:DNA-binding MarR family transcriptional regulator